MTNGTSLISLNGEHLRTQIYLRIKNAYTHYGWIANPTEQRMGRALSVGVVTLGQWSAACERNTSSAEVATVGCYFTLSTEGSAGYFIRRAASAHKEQRVELTDIEWIPWVVGLDSRDKERHCHLPRLSAWHDLFPVLLSHGCNLNRPASHSYRVRASGGNGRLAVGADEYVVTCFHNLTMLQFLRVLVV